MTINRTYLAGLQYARLVAEENWPQAAQLDILDDAIAQAQASETCPTCGEDEPYTGTCGTSDSDTRALCKQAQAAPEAEPVAWQWVYANGGTSPVYMGKGPDAEFVAAGLAAEFPRRVRYLYAAPQHDAELIELLERCIHRWDKLSSAFIYTTPSYKEEQAHIDELRAKLATLRHV